MPAEFLNLIGDVPKSNLSEAQFETLSGIQTSPGEQKIKDISNVTAPAEKQTMSQNEFFDIVDNAVTSGNFRGQSEEQVYNGMLESITQDGIIIEGITPTPKEEIIEEVVEEVPVAEEKVSPFSIQAVEEAAGRAIAPLRKIGEVATDVGKFFKFESEVDDGVIESGVKFLANLPGNSIQITGDIITAGSDPFGTAKSVKTLAKSMIETGLNKALLDEGEEVFTSEETRLVSEAISDGLDKLGEPGAIKELLVENPGDVLLTVTGGLSVAKNVAKAKGFTGLSNKIGKIEKLTNPINVLKAEGKLAKEAAKAPFTLPAKAIRAITPENVSKAIANVDDIAANALKLVSKEKLDDVLNIAKKATQDIKAPTPFAKAGQKAQQVVDDLFVQKNLVGKAKGDALKKVASKTVNTKPMVDKFDNLLAERFNLRVADDGSLVAIKGKIPKSVKELKGFTDDLQELRTAPLNKISLDNLDALVDNLQQSLNRIKLERPGAKLTTAEKTINGFIEGTINKTLKEKAGAKFIKANEDFREVSNLVSDLEKALGPQGTRAEGLFKSIFSPQTGERTKQLFKKAEKITGIDLAQDAVLAKFAMEAVGDTRGLSLINAATQGSIGIIDPGLIQKALQTIFKPEVVGRGLAGKGLKGLNKAGAAKSAIAKNKFDLNSLKKIGEGTDRKVFDLGDGTVLKVAKNKRGIAQNQGALSKNLEEAGIIPEIREIGKDYVIMEKLPKFNQLSLSDTKKLNNFKQDMLNISNEINKGNTANVDKVLRKYGWEELGRGDLKNFGWGDIGDKNLSIKNGKPILIDEGTINLIETVKKFDKIEILKEFISKIFK